MSHYFPISRAAAATASGSSSNLAGDDHDDCLRRLLRAGWMELDEDGYYEIECPKCQRTAHRMDWEAVEGCVVNAYWHVSCAHCGYGDSNKEDYEFDDDDDRPPYPYEEVVNDPGFWKEDRFEESTVEPEPMTAISGPAKAEWVTRDDLVALAQGRPLSFS